ncbi:MAG: hypothetical protein LBC79_02290 [Deltaproteobacteria bacterium]|jgi:hypothetical protein|nr:hypothetical protein [Deltaproteobacteria bacterium]
MTTLQCRRLGTALKILSRALERGDWTHAELAALMKRIKPDFDAVYAEALSPSDPFEKSGHPVPTPWDWTTEMLARSAGKIETPKPIDAVTADRQLPKPDRNPSWPHWYEPMRGKPWGLEASLPVGDRA